MPQPGNTTLNKLRRRRLAPHAFTLIELLASTLLSAMLMLVIVGLMRTTTAQSKAARHALQSNPPTSILADQIRRDFVNAKHIEIRPNRVRVAGYMAQDVRTGRQTFRPAEVTYAIMSNRQTTWLVRQETQFNATIGKRSRLEVAWSEVDGLTVVSLDDAEGESAVAPPGMKPMPSHLIFTIHKRDGQTVLREDIFHHHTVQ